MSKIFWSQTFNSSEKVLTFTRGRNFCVFSSKNFKVTSKIARLTKWLQERSGFVNFEDDIYFILNHILEGSFLRYSRNLKFLIHSFIHSLSFAKIFPKSKRVFQDLSKDIIKCSIRSLIWESFIGKKIRKGQNNKS